MSGFGVKRVAAIIRPGHTSRIHSLRGREEKGDSLRHGAPISTEKKNFQKDNEESVKSFA